MKKTLIFVGLIFLMSAYAFPMWSIGPGEKIEVMSKSADLVVLGELKGIKYDELNNCRPSLTALERLGENFNNSVQVRMNL